MREPGCRMQLQNITPVPVKLLSPVAEDRYGNTIAPDGELTDGNTIIVKAEIGFSLPFLILCFTGDLIIYSCSTGKKVVSVSQDEKQAVLL